MLWPRVNVGGGGRKVGTRGVSPSSASVLHVTSLPSCPQAAQWPPEREAPGGGAEHERKMDRMKEEHQQVVAEARQ